MQELKRSSYKHVTAAVIGSRDQLCIHPEVSKEHSSFIKIQMCQAKVKGRTCFYYNNVASRQDDPIFKQEIMDIEDLVKVGQKMKCCPYFLSRELKQRADITFMPYNYLLDPKTRKTQGIELQNNVVLLDEGHNVEKMCEEAASLQISSTDIAICIDAITAIMQDFANEATNCDFSQDITSNLQKDFSSEDLCILKEMFLELEKAIDSIEIKKREEGETLPGEYIFELLEKAQLTHGKEQLVIDKLDKIILYLSTTSTSPFTRKGNGLQKFSDLLRIAFSSGGSLQHRQNVMQCYKVHIQFEESKKNYKNDGWEIKKPSSTKNEGKLISYWCFSPGFGMKQLVEQGIRSVIITSGTLSPLKPTISELSIPISVQLENPHVISGSQVCVGVLSKGPDGYQLNSSYNTRNNPKYIASLGRTIYNFSCLIPDGILVFFPSYSIMKKCRDDWQNTGLWTQIADRKPIYVEPHTKDGFVNVMNEYYQKIRDPSCKGALFMAVCRGKVSEGLDFADANGRAVLITGLPYPPFKDPRVVLKQKYLEELRSKNKEGLTGKQWYQLEASRAVNQAIGRIIRHKNDYGAIILCDCRFEDSNFKSQLSAWLRPHITKFDNFGTITRNLREFFRHAGATLPRPKMQALRNDINEYSLPAVPARFDIAVSRPVKTNVKVEAESTLKLEESSIEYSSDKAPIENSKEIDFTEFTDVLSTASRTVINFSDCKLKDDWTRCELTQIVTEPAAKKRKLKILPLGFNANVSEPSTSRDLTFADTTNISTQSEETTKDAVRNKKRELGINYVKSVKLSLTKEKFKVFRTMADAYRKHGKFEDLMNSLEYLFSAKENLQHLFEGFRMYLKKEHESFFDEHIKNMKRNSHLSGYNNEIASRECTSWTLAKFFEY
ncbi:regulator of telomere elongation helicase 1 homolog isoform X2 [Cephus cinctus]|nr:regulator of telomere elongation helicase 1 homolog isoform X2 [Cephus cinctus]